MGTGWIITSDETTLWKSRVYILGILSQVSQKCWAPRLSNTSSSKKTNSRLESNLKNMKEYTWKCNLYQIICTEGPCVYAIFQWVSFSFQVSRRLDECIKAQEWTTIHYLLMPQSIWPLLCNTYNAPWFMFGLKHGVYIIAHFYKIPLLGIGQKKQLQQLLGLWKFEKTVNTVKVDKTHISYPLQDCQKWKCALD